MNTADLSKRLAACPRLRWLPGMLMLPEAGDDVGRRVVAVQEDQHWLRLDNGDELATDIHDLAPDLDDPATLGALEFGLLAGLGGQLAFAQGCWYLDCDRRGAMILFDDDHNPPFPKARTHALVLALESYGAET
jgi:hypothetical protein